MNLRKIREDLGRVRASCQRHELVRALNLTISAFKELGGQAAPTDLRGDFRTALSFLCADPEFKKEYAKPLPYQLGKERELHNTLLEIYKSIKGTEGQEDYETTLKRKICLDRCLREARQFLAVGKISEADAAYAHALKFYKNETSVFAMMAKALMEAGEYVRALGHIRHGLKEKPGDVDLLRLADECTRRRAEMEK